MEGCWSARFGIACFFLAQGAWANNGMLHAQGASAPLRLPASVPHAAGPQASDGQGLLAVSLEAGAADAVPAGEVLPSPARRPLPYVNTGGASLNISGLAAGAGGVSGAAGAYQYVQSAGGQIAVYRKEDGARLMDAASVAALFAGAPSNAPMDACRAQQVQDAAVHHDQLSMRWIVAYPASGASAQAGRYLCLAVSMSADAGGAYHRYVFDMGAMGGAAAHTDDPRLAVWADGYYFSFARFDRFHRYLGARLCGVEREALAAGAAARYRCIDTGPEAGPASPVRFEGYPAGGGEGAALFLALATGPRAPARLHLWRLSWHTGLPAQAVTLAAPAYTPACANRLRGRCVQQPFSAVALPAIGDRLAPGAVYRNAGGRALLLAGHPVQLEDGSTALRWYEIGDAHGAPHVASHGTLAKAGEHRWMASGGIDRAGNIAFGYNIAAHDTPAGIRYTGREPQDPPGMLQSEEVLVNGAGAATGHAPARLSGQMSLDPSDGCTFWYTQRYVPASGPDNWSTRIARFRFRSCR